MIVTFGQQRRRRGVMIMTMVGLWSTTATTTSASATGGGSSSSTGQKAWRQEDYPDPSKSPEVCRAASRLCDPDAILWDSEKQKILRQIEVLEQGKGISCSDEPSSTEGTSVEGNQEPVQLAVALAAHVDLIPFGPYEDRGEKAAESFAVHLHNQWGVGKTTDCGGTGALLFLSVGDRALYVSRGKAVENVLTDRRIDRVIENMKPLLRNERYGQAILQAVEEIQHYISIGEPPSHEKRMDFIHDMLPIGLFAAIFGFIYLGIRHQQREQRMYAQVQSQLSQIDRDRAEALQGRYRCRSCPICLESFQLNNETGLAEKGSDGLPLKLLRCGHVFDETCWNEWVTSGHGNVRRCPICQQDVGASASETTMVADQRRPAASAGEDDGRDAQDRVFRQFHRERNFRLARLGRRYPRYVRPDMIQRWSQTTYNSALSRDPTFVRSNPRHHSSSGGYNNSSMGNSSFRGGGFGGGSSSGGRGGSW